MREVLGELIGSIALLITPWRTLMFVLGVINCSIVVIALTLIGIVDTQAEIMTQQSTILSHILSIEASHNYLIKQTFEDTIGRSYLDSRPAIEIDRSPIDVESYRPRAP